MWTCPLAAGCGLRIDLGVIGNAIAWGEDDAVALLQAADDFRGGPEVAAENKVTEVGDVAFVDNEGLRAGGTDNRAARGR